MTKKIEEELNLPSIKEALAALKDEELVEDDEVDLEEIKSALANYSTMTKSLSGIDNFTENSKKLDELQQKAIDAHTDLMDGGFTAPPTQTGGYFEPAISSLNIALDVEKVKINNKLKLLQLQMEQRKLDLAERKQDLAERKLAGENGGEELTQSSEGVYTTREEIIKTFKNMNADK